MKSILIIFFCKSFSFRTSTQLLQRDPWNTIENVLSLFPFVAPQVDQLYTTFLRRLCVTQNSIKLWSRVNSVSLLWTKKSDQKIPEMSTLQRISYNISFFIPDPTTVTGDQKRSHHIFYNIFKTIIQSEGTKEQTPKISSISECM